MMSAWNLRDSDFGHLCEYLMKVADFACWIGCGAENHRRDDWPIEVRSANSGFGVLRRAE
jgi:hypothetical protein